MSLMARVLTPEYNCAHFFVEAWQHETGDDVSHAFHGFTQVRSQRTADNGVRRYFRPVRAPLSPCLVLMRRGNSTPHVGLYKRGQVWHLTHEGVVRQLLSVACLGYQKVGFYAKRPDQH